MKKLMMTVGGLSLFTALFLTSIIFGGSSVSGENLAVDQQNSNKTRKDRKTKKGKNKNSNSSNVANMGMNATNVEVDANMMMNNNAEIDANMMNANVFTDANMINANVAPTNGTPPVR